MPRLIIFIVILLPLENNTVYAQSTFAEGLQSELPKLYANDLEWKEMRFGMTEWEYKRTAKYNKKLIRREIRNYLENRFDSLGNTGTALKFSSAALLMMFDDTKLNLNRSKTIFLEAKDLAENDRAIMYRMNYSW